MHKAYRQQSEKLLLPRMMPEIRQIGNRNMCRKHGCLRCRVAYVADTILYFMNEYMKEDNRVQTRYYVIYARGRLFGNGRKERQNMGEESRIERMLTSQVKKLGGMAVKFVSSGLDGVPDRIVLLPDGKMAFVELKAPGKKLRALQEKRKRQLEALGFPVYVIDRLEQIGGVLDEICAT